MNIKRSLLAVVWLQMIAVLFPSVTNGQDFGFGNYQVVSSTRVGRTQFQYQLKVSITNKVADATGVSAQVFSTSPDTQITQDTVTFGTVGYGANTASQSTFTILQNRLVPFNPNVLMWFVSAQMKLSLSVTSPTNGFLTATTNVTVTGSVGPGVDGVIVNQHPASLANSNFSITIGIDEGKDTISVVATNDFGGSAVENVSITRDTTPPIVSIQYPTNGSVFSSRQVSVLGLVHDSVPGTVNPGQATVMVNGLSAAIANRSYSIDNILLVPGSNTITSVGIDKAGNQSQAQVNVVFNQPASQKKLNKLQGDGQSGIINTQLALPLLVELVDDNGSPQTNQPVTFAIARGDGSVSSSTNSGRSVTVNTDDKGQGRVLLTMGSRNGNGNNQVAVTSPGVDGEVDFIESATANTAFKISPLVPETQVGSVSSPLPATWRAQVTDAGGNPVQGAAVKFEVTDGGGNFSGAISVTNLTDSDGRAEVTLTLGSEEGTNNNIVIATTDGVTNSSAIYKASGLVTGAVADTRVLGLVLDNANHPMSNILCSIVGSPRAAVTDVNGQFVITHAPVGSIQLLVDAQNRGYPGTWHSLQFGMVTIAGRDNLRDRPIYMIQVDPDSTALVGGDKDVTIHLKNFPGAELTVFAHSVRDAAGNQITTNVTWTQVNAERIPEEPPQGSQPILTTAILPAGFRFVPPAKMCIPNNGQAPGQVLELYGFDHDIGTFVSAGTATVSSDGSLICSDPGFGVSKSGWHPVLPPPPPCTPVCSGPPADTDCIHYETVPPATRCDCPTYIPHMAKILTLDVNIPGGDPADVCTNQNLTMQAYGTAEYCNSGLDYEWDFGDGSPKVQTAYTSHTYTNAGTYTATVTVKCHSCPAAQKSKTVTVNAYYVEIQVNNTASTNDDLVQLKCDHPVKVFKTPCQAHIVGNSSKNVAVTIQNPGGQVMFPTAGSLMLSLPSGGGFVPFEISGQTASAALGDAVIQAMGTSGICGKVNASVVSFDNAALTLTANGTYTVTDTATKRTIDNVPGPSVSWAASARIRPAGVDCSAAPVSNLRVSVTQNITFTDTTIYDTPTPAWAPGVTNGYSINIPTTVTMTTTSPGYVNDYLVGADPLYKKGGSAVQFPTGCMGAANSTSSDRPNSTVNLTLVLNTTVMVGGVPAARLTYHLKRFNSLNSFRDWAVIYDTGTMDICAIKQSGWTCNFADDTLGTPVAAASGAVANDPVTGPPSGNDVANGAPYNATTYGPLTTLTK